jgi:SAM-dependent methyltransferase
MPTHRENFPSWVVTVLESLYPMPGCWLCNPHDSIPLYWFDSMSADLLPECRICAGRTEEFGHKLGKVTNTVYRFCRCQSCHFIFVINPCLDYQKLYDIEYYKGNGADSLVDYFNELEHPRTVVRQYEWWGISNVIECLAGNLKNLTWLDWGCGNGGLVRYLRENNVAAVGFEEGGIVPLARAKGIVILDPSELGGPTPKLFSIITMIEVIEHVPDPLPLLRRVRNHLKPGGILFMTTGNAALHQDRFTDWGYVSPDIHVSYFDPHNLALALSKSGFEPEFPGYMEGWNNIIRFKLLKNIGWRKTNLLERSIPWKLASPWIDRKVGCSAHPIGRAV